MAKRRPRKLSTSDAILTVLATGVVLASPVGTGLLIRNLLKELSRDGGNFSSEDDSEEGRVRSSLYRLQKGGYIEKNIKDNAVSFILTKKGRRRMNVEQAHVFSVGRQENWDGLWRFAMFDIPEKERRLRSALRDAIREADFFQVQKSVWVHPYPCTKEIEKLADSLGVRSYLLLFEGKVDRENELKRFFRKKGYSL